MYSLKYVASFIIWLFASVSNCLGTLPQKLAHMHSALIEKDCNFGEIYIEKVNSSVEYNFWFVGYVNETIDDVIIKAQTRVENGATEQNKVLFEMKWKERLGQPEMSWLVPFSVNGQLYHQINKTSCSEITQNNTTDERIVTVKVTVSTLSILPVEFTLSVDFGESSVIKQFDRWTDDVAITLFSPVYFKVKINETRDTQLVEYAEVEITSDDNTCLTVSWQPASKCLVTNNLKVENGRYLTMSRTATVSIKMDQLVEGGYLVFIIHENDSKCSDYCEGCLKNEIMPMVQLTGGNGMSRIRSKNLSFIFQYKRPNVKNNWWRIIGDLVVLPILFLMICCCKHGCGRRIGNEKSIKDSNESRAEGSEKRRNDVNTTEESISETKEELGGNGEVKNQMIGRKDREVVCVCGFFLKRYNNSHLFLSLDDDLLNVERTSLQAYFGTLLGNASLYILPSIQLVRMYHLMFREQGDEDTCYFNFRCLHPWAGITAFNHVYSNRIYVYSGVLFILFVKIYGSKKPNGIYHTLGVALALEGGMNAVYDACPNQLSFQFNTCFAYIVTMHCFVNFYQAQYPDSTANRILSHTVGVLLGITAMFFPSRYFWILIMILHVGLCLLISIHLDARYGGYKCDLDWPCRKSFTEFCYSFGRPFHPSSFNRTNVTLIIVNFMNIVGALGGHWILKNSMDFAFCLLVLFILNLLIFSFVHLSIRFNEKIGSLETIFYLVLSIPTWAVAVYFYFSKSANWELSPAQSRLLNLDCLVENNDAHYMWQLSSAFGLYLNFMFFHSLDAEYSPCSPTATRWVALEVRQQQSELVAEDRNDQDPKSNGQNGAEVITSITTIV